LENKCRTQYCDQHSDCGGQVPIQEERTAKKKLEEEKEDEDEKTRQDKK
jgi:hypothetical protein